MLNQFKLLVLFVGLCCFNVNALEIAVKGLGAIVNANVADARKNALEDAKRVAVEQMLGSYISARTETNNFMLASEKIYSTAKGQIDGYDILEEGKMDEYTYFVQIKAHLDEKQTLSTVNQQLVKFKWYKQPKISIVSHESHGEHASTTHSIFITELSKNLQKLGFNIIRSTTESALSPSFIISSDLTTHIARSEYQGLQVESNQLSVAAQLINAQTGQVMSGSTESKNAAGTNSLTLFNNMATDLAYRVAQRINLDTKVLWLNDNTQSVLLNLQSDDNQQIASVEAALKNAVVGLTALQIQSRLPEMVSYYAEYQGWPEQLYEQINNLSADANIPFKVTFFNGSEITISAKN